MSDALSDREICLAKKKRHRPKWAHRPLDRNIIASHDLPDQPPGGCEESCALCGSLVWGMGLEGAVEEASPRRSGVPGDFGGLFATREIRKSLV